MIISNDSEKYNIINLLVDFFLNNVVKYDLKPFFKINISNNIVEDYVLFNKKYTPKFNDYAGLTILPDNKENVIQILISDNSIKPDIILHELTHMYDFVRFASYFCKNKLYIMTNHRYYQTFVYWSEFHVKQIDIPYLHLLLDIVAEVPKEKYLDSFKEKIKTFYYPEYIKKFLNKKNPNIRDIMWYLGELFVCNTYDKNNIYSIPQEIVDIYGAKIIKLHNLMTKCTTFEEYVQYAEDFHNYFL